MPTNWGVKLYPPKVHLQLPFGKPLLPAYCVQCNRHWARGQERQSPEEPPSRVTPCCWCKQYGNPSTGKRNKDLLYFATVCFCWTKRFGQQPSRALEGPDRGKDRGDEGVPWNSDVSAPLRLLGVFSARAELSCSNQGIFTLDAEQLVRPTHALTRHTWPLTVGLLPLKNGNLFQIHDLTNLGYVCLMIKIRGTKKSLILCVFSYLLRMLSFSWVLLLHKLFT